MEKQQAIELLEHLAWDIDRNPYGDALNMAIDALKGQLKECTTFDLIERQEALNFKTKITDLPGDTTMEEARGWSAGVRMYEKYIKKLPIVQQEIIYCGECKKYHTMCDGKCRCSALNVFTKPTDYCSLAERRTDD